MMNKMPCRITDEGPSEPELLWEDDFDQKRKDDIEEAHERYNESIEKVRDDIYEIYREYK